MATLAQMTKRIFRHAWLRYGQPTMLVVRPLSDWTLPAGFAYDQTVDCIRNNAGVVIRNPEDYWVTDLVYILPNRSERSGSIAELQEMLVTGQVTSGGIGVWVLGADIAKVKASHAIKLFDEWYELDHQTPQPAGDPSGAGLWAYVRLKART